MVYLRLFLARSQPAASRFRANDSYPTAAWGALFALALGACESAETAPAGMTTAGTAGGIAVSAAAAGGTTNTAAGGTTSANNGGAAADTTAGGATTIMNANSAGAASLPVGGTGGAATTTGDSTMTPAAGAPADASMNTGGTAGTPSGMAATAGAAANDAAGGAPTDDPMNGSAGSTNDDMQVAGSGSGGMGNDLAEDAAGGAAGGAEGGSDVDPAMGGESSAGDDSGGGVIIPEEPAGCGVPTSFNWTSSDALIGPPSGSVSIKDPSILFHDGKWHIYATHYSDSYSLMYMNFTDWESADSAEKIPVATNRNLAGYKAAPQIFYYAPQELWYLVYQTQPPAYATTTDITDVSSWSESKLFMDMPSIITNSNTGGIDYWIICDDTDCYMFFSADNGVLYRAKTSREDFPEGFEDTTVIVMTDSTNALFEAANVYKMAGTDQYLLLHEAISGGRYFRSWTADSLDGDWTALADTKSNPFASTSNVSGAGWSNDGISHGEMLRDNPDETMTIDTCNMQYLFQGRTRIGGSYDLHEYSLGLLTSTN